MGVVEHLLGDVELHELKTRNGPKDPRDEQCQNGRGDENWPAGGSALLHFGLVL